MKAVSVLCPSKLGDMRRANVVVLWLQLTRADPAPADILVGLVVGVRDGDGLTVLDVNKRQHKVRLAGIDAPEMGQPYGQRSKEGLSDLAFHRHVTT